MAATTGSGERGRRARLAEGVRARAGVRGPAKALAAGPGPLLPPSAGLRGGDPGGLKGEEEQAVAGSTGGGLRGLWAARRGSPGRREGPAERKSRARPHCEQPERARGQPHALLRRPGLATLWRRSRGLLEKKVS